VSTGQQSGIPQGIVLLCPTDFSLSVNHRHCNTKQHWTTLAYKPASTLLYIL